MRRKRRRTARAATRTHTHHTQKEIGEGAARLEPSLFCCMHVIDVIYLSLISHVLVQHVLVQHVLVHVVM